MADPTDSFEEYWVEFVRAYQSPRSRRTRFLAMTAGLALSAAGAITKRTGLFLAALAVAAVPGIGALRTLRADGAAFPIRVSFAARANLRMWEMTLLGTMGAEVRRIVGEPTSADPVEEPGQPPIPRPNMVTDHTLH